MSDYEMTRVVRLARYSFQYYRSLGRPKRRDVIHVHLATLTLCEHDMTGLARRRESVSLCCGGVFGCWCISGVVMVWWCLCGVLLFLWLRCGGVFVWCMHVW